MLGSSHITAAAASARSKLQLASGSGSRDNGSLHRFVLLKNSLLGTLSPALAVVQPSTTPSPSPVEAPEPTDNAFVFPDPSPAKSSEGEAQWFDQLFEELEHDEDEDDEEDDCLACAVDAEQPLPALPDSDGDDLLDEFEPVFGPAASDDDLLAPSHPHSRPAYAYAPPLLASSSYAYPPLPYPPLDDEEPPVPDAVPDDSDDESDAPSTPSLLRSSASSGARAPLAVAIVDAYRDDDDDDAFGFDDAYFFPDRDTAQEC